MLKVDFDVVPKGSCYVFLHGYLLLLAFLLHTEAFWWSLQKSRNKLTQKLQEELGVGLTGFPAEIFQGPVREWPKLPSLAYLLVQGWKGLC